MKVHTTSPTRKKQSLSHPLADPLVRLFMSEFCIPSQHPPLATCSKTYHVIASCWLTLVATEVIPGFLSKSKIYSLQQATLPGAIGYEQPRRQVRNPETWAQQQKLQIVMFYDELFLMISMV